MSHPSGNIITPNSLEVGPTGWPPPCNTGATAPPPPLPSPLGAPVIIGRAAFDWLTLTTWDRGAYVDAVRCLSDVVDEKPEVSKVLQYKGEKGEHFFVGEGIQESKPHFLVRVSGALADDFAQLAHGQGWLPRFKPSRTDVQVTGNLDNCPGMPVAARWLRRKYREEPLERAGKAPQVDYRSNQDKLDTIYIGGRSSRRMHRVYVKPVGATEMLRWEIEYKKDCAQQVYEQMLIRGPRALSCYLAGELDAVPLVQLPGFAALRQLLEPEGMRPERKHEKPDADRWFRWFEEAVVPSARRHGRGPQRGKVLRVVAKLLIDLLDEPEAIFGQEDAEFVNTLPKEVYEYLEVCRKEAERAKQRQEEREERWRNRWDNHHEERQDND